MRVSAFIDALPSPTRWSPAISCSHSGPTKARRLPH